ncbi:MAG: dienelactone hydrolase family protein [Woeseiaceae bacterium]
MNRECSRPAIVAGAMCILLGLAACQPRSDNTEADPTSADRKVETSGESAGSTGSPDSTPAAGAERAVVAETLPYAEVDDELFYGHFVFPSDMVEPLPALIVVHEWWGLNDDVRAAADKLAAEGYIVLAIDLFGGKTADLPASARELMLEVLENPESANENIRQAYAFVRDTAGAPTVGSVGWDFGGAWALNTALLFPDDLDAVVIYYGQVIDSADKLAPLNVPILGLFAENDRVITVESVQKFQDALDSLGKTYEIEIFPGTGHAFANPKANHYDAAVAAQAWQRTVEFLDQYLSPDAAN